MPFTNEIVAGSQGSLIRNSIQSPNFVAGVSGWIVRKDGSVEFNNGTFRGSLTSGTNPGKHIILNNVGGTGDAIDVYDSSNRLVFAVDNNGVLRAWSWPAGNQLVINGAGILFGPGNGLQNISQGMTPSWTATVSTLDLNSGTISGTDVQARIDINSGQTAAGAFIELTQRGVVGSAVQTDTTGVNPVNNLIHVAQYSVTYTAASFTQVFNHGCNFTPSFAMCSFDDGSAINSAICHIVAGTITATQATLYTNYVPGLGSPALGDVVIVNVIFVA